MTYLLFFVFKQGASWGQEVCFSNLYPALAALKYTVVNFLNELSQKLASVTSFITFKLALPRVSESTILQSKRVSS